jgi:hypothetical protein
MHNLKIKVKVEEEEEEKEKNSNILIKTHKTLIRPVC